MSEPNWPDDYVVHFGKPELVVEDPPNPEHPLYQIVLPEPTPEVKRLRDWMNEFTAGFWTSMWGEASPVGTPHFAPGNWQVFTKNGWEPFEQADEPIVVEEKP